jgi:hypothetical protein
MVHSSAMIPNANQTKSMYKSASKKTKNNIRGPTNTQLQILNNNIEFTIS